MKKLYVAFAIIIAFAVTEGCRKQSLANKADTAATKGAGI